MVESQLEVSDELIEAAGFGDEGISAESVGPFDIGRVAGSGEDDDRKGTEFGMGANPFQDVKAAELGEREVEQDELGQWKEGGVGIRAGAREVKKGGCAVRSDLQAEFGVQGAKGFADGRNIRGIIFDQQNSMFAHRHRSARPSCARNVHDPEVHGIN